MKANTISKGFLQTIAIVFGILLLIYFLYKIQSLLLYLFIAGVISLIFRPVVYFFKHKLKVGRNLSAFITLLIIGGLFALILWLFVPIILEQSKNISEIDFEMVKTDLNELSIQASEYLGVEKINIIEAIKRTEFVRNFDSEIVESFVNIFVNNITNFIIGLFSVLFISFFLLKDERMISNAVAIFAEEGKERRFLRVLDKVKELLSRYFIGLMIQTMIMAVFYLVLLSYIDVKNALAIAVICAFLNIVPYLGPLLGGVVMILVVVSNNLGADFSSDLLPLLIKVMIGVAIAQLIDNLVSQPFIFSQSVRSHPLEVFIVIICGGLLFSIPGMILAVPVYTTIKVISKEFLSEYKIVKQLTKNL
ncbi:putative PurR-regulated permease PerM [Gelidibacter algens]|jgi:predicted PurR-regulated permease PerM|uniref:Putative PurR-regulated permease PerM n=1 Tax=Gelidibacter algens TaxID=49280 RepID=A0A1A7R4X9_9FLAO|nr:AI-2E family transporter [Gelidibacter algens]OBX26558.1 AI-2E family transporter [Gelidibacter algens]RAJ26612.1 putative PurR-regulated permease PerM [Gelidibacter algens]